MTKLVASVLALRSTVLETVVQWESLHPFRVKSHMHQSTHFIFTSSLFYLPVRVDKIPDIRFPYPNYLNPDSALMFLFPLFVADGETDGRRSSSEYCIFRVNFRVRDRRTDARRWRDAHRTLSSYRCGTRTLAAGSHIFVFLRRRTAMEEIWSGFGGRWLRVCSCHASQQVQECRRRRCRVQRTVCLLIFCTNNVLYCNPKSTQSARDAGEVR
jgi:hypothetical protein